MQSNFPSIPLGAPQSGQCRDPKQSFSFEIHQFSILEAMAIPTGLLEIFERTVESLL